MAQSTLIEQLIDALRCLPGVGPKSAQRMAFHILQHGRANGQMLAKSLEQAITHVRNCQQCRTLSEKAVCDICSNQRRDNSLLCIVESPADIIAIEQTNSYHGLYFVLLGHLSPLDGIGPENIGMPQLSKLLQHKLFQEIIIATNPTIEGEATAYYIANMLRGNPAKITRLAHGVPMGGELEYIDSNTLHRALNGRLVMEKIWE